MAGRSGFPLAWRIPCERVEALDLLVDVEGWLRFRARSSALLGLLLAAAGVAAGLLLGGGLLWLGVASGLLLGAVGLWGWRGSMGLARDVGRLREGIERGLVSLEDYCGVSVVAAVAALRVRGGAG